MPDPEKRSEQPAPAGARKPGFFERQRRRADLRRQLAERERLLLELGAIVYELHRQGQRAPELLQARAAELDEVDGAVRAMQASLDGHDPAAWPAGWDQGSWESGEWAGHEREWEPGQGPEQESLDPSSAGEGRWRAAETGDDAHWEPGDARDDRWEPADAADDRWEPGDAPEDRWEPASARDDDRWEESGDPSEDRWRQAGSAEQSGDKGWHSDDGETREWRPEDEWEDDWVDPDEDLGETQEWSADDVADALGGSAGAETSDETSDEERA